MGRAIKEICRYEMCTGCAVCAVSCKTSCIRMVENKEGFFYPCIDTEKCIGCKVCLDKCPAASGKTNKKPQTDACFAAWSTNQDERFTSSSGGVFPEIARCILNEGGTVFGAAYNAQREVVHVRITEVEELPRLKGSKYYQSSIADSYSKVKTDLNNHLSVLFSGTGCQIAALLNYVGNISEGRLITAEILCHGVPSKKTVDRYLTSIHPACKVDQVVFRDKKDLGWIRSSVFFADFCDGTYYRGYSGDDAFYMGFLGNLFLRECCYNCKFAGTERVGDITLADYWGVNDHQVPGLTESDYNLGISLLLVNTNSGMKLIEKVTQAGKIELIRGNLDEARKSNLALSMPCPRHPQRTVFFKRVDKTDYRRLIATIFPLKIMKIRMKKLLRIFLGERLYQKLKSLKRTQKKDR